MEVLVVESAPRAADKAIAALEALGHQVRRCHAPTDAQSFPCIGLASGRCPLEEDQIDVALTVRTDSDPDPTALEDGITCALRRRVPVVVAGCADPNPFASHGATAAHGGVTDACERATTERRSDYETVARTALDWTLRYRDLPPHLAGVVITRAGDGLQVTLHLPARASKLVRDMAAVRVAGALRSFDPDIPRINVVCELNA